MSTESTEQIQPVGVSEIIVSPVAKGKRELSIPVPAAPQGSSPLQAKSMDATAAHGSGGAEELTAEPTETVEGDKAEDSCDSDESEDSEEEGGLFSSLPAELRAKMNARMDEMRRKSEAAAQMSKERAKQDVMNSLGLTDREASLALEVCNGDQDEAIARATADEDFMLGVRTIIEEEDSRLRAVELRAQQAAAKDDAAEEIPEGEVSADTKELAVRVRERQRRKLPRLNNSGSSRLHVDAALNLLNQQVTDGTPSASPPASSPPPPSAATASISAPSLPIVARGAASGPSSANATASSAPEMTAKASPGKSNSRARASPAKSRSPSKKPTATKRSLQVKGSAKSASPKRARLERTAASQQSKAASTSPGKKKQPTLSFAKQQATNTTSAAAKGRRAPSKASKSAKATTSQGKKPATPRARKTAAKNAIKVAKSPSTSSSSPKRMSPGKPASAPVSVVAPSVGSDGTGAGAAASTSQAAPGSPAPIEVVPPSAAWPFPRPFTPDIRPKPTKRGAKSGVTMKLNEQEEVLASKLREMGLSEARLKAYLKKDANPNAYYYRFNEPGEQQATGGWSRDERVLFFNLLREKGLDYQWGNFSINVPGRVGYQCSNFYRKMILEGYIYDPNYYIDDAKQLRFKFKTKSESSSGPAKKRKPATKKASVAKKPRISAAARGAARALRAKPAPRARRRRSGHDSDEEEALPMAWAPPPPPKDAPRALPGFVDVMTQEEVINPAISPYGHVLGYHTWLRCLSRPPVNQCPFTKRKLTRRQLVKLTPENVEEHREKIVSATVSAAVERHAGP